MSIEDMLYILTICESLIAVYWLINGIAFKNVGAVKEKCGGCFILSLFSIFILTFEWIFFTCSLHNLHCFFDPIMEENYKQRLFYYFFISGGVSGLYVYFIFLTGVYGISVEFF